MNALLNRMLLSAAGLMLVHAAAAGEPESEAPPGPPFTRGGAADYYVATNGDDAWSGRIAEPNAEGTDGPFASLTAARDAIRRRKKEGALQQPLTVLLRGGVYRLTEPLVFTPEDSGTEQGPITYAAYPGEKPILSGGRPLTGWRKGPGETWTLEIPEVRDGDWYFYQLFVNGERRTRARSPNEGYYRVADLVGVEPNAPWNQGVDRFRFEPGDVRNWDHLSDVEVVLFHSWNTSRLRIDTVDEEERVVTFTGPSVFRPNAWEPHNRYYVENAEEALDAPGEWYLNRETGVLTYWPLPGETPSSPPVEGGDTPPAPPFTRGGGGGEVVAPLVEQLVRFVGQPEVGLWVEHLRLVGLSFQHSDWSLEPQGYGDPQAAVTVPAAIAATGARFCTLEGCEVAHVGTYAVWFGRGCQRNRIVQNHLHDLGAGGVRIGEAAMAQEDEAEASQNEVVNNYIHDGGHVYAAGVGVWVAQSSHNTIAHNEIHDLDYSGMSVGWNWDDAPNRTHHNVVENNHIHHVLRGVLSDGAGIYTLGTSPGTVLRGNLIHDVLGYQPPGLGWGIYLDATSNGILVENNLCYNTLSGGFMGHNGAHDNVIQNNLFARSATVLIWPFLPGGNNVFQHNICYVTQGELFLPDARPDPGSVWDRNLYFDASGQPLAFGDYSFEEWQEQGMDPDSLVADPLFVDPERFDFRLKPESPAFQLGFQALDLSQAGLIGPPEWVNRPKLVHHEPTAFPLIPPPTPVEDDFEDTAVGDPPKGATVSGEEQGASIRVTDETAATGEHSLKFTDAPGLEQVWQPHLFYSPHCRQGLLRLSFDLRVEPGAIVWTEWRDAAQPYRVGPSFQIDGTGQLLVNGQLLRTVPLEEWFHVEVVCGLGTQATGTYDLTVTVPGEEPQTFPEQPCGDPKFKRLHWLGFVSLATEETAFYLDNVKLEEV